MIIGSPLVGAAATASPPEAGWGMSRNEARTLAWGQSFFPLKTFTW